MTPAATPDALVAEIEAVMRKHVKATVTPRLDTRGATVAFHGFESAAAEIAALQSRAFEDGAPSLVAKQAVAAMRHRYEHFDQQAALADCRDYQLGYQSGIRVALQAVGLWDAALAPNSTEGRSDRA